MIDDRFNEIKEKYSDYEEAFKSGNVGKAADILGEILEIIEDEAVCRRAGKLDRNLKVCISDGEGRICMSLNHVMEYYMYMCYFAPSCDVKIFELPINTYYRTYGDLCIRLSKYKMAEDAYKKALCWNPADLDAYLGLAESYKYLNMLTRYLDITKQAYRFCCTRATMARYYRNMGYYYLSVYQTDLARACYLYSNIYYHTENADSELSYLEQALGDETPDFSIKEMQEMFDSNGIEPGPDSKTIGIIYRVGQLMMEDKDYELAKDCFSIVYDITQEEQLGRLLEEMP